MRPRELFYYKTLSGHIPFQEWYDGILDKPLRSKIAARLYQTALGNYGDFKNVGMGVFEMRIHLGPGYRIYFGFAGLSLLIVLLTGDKSSQIADIQKAQVFWQDYLRRK